MIQPERPRARRALSTARLILRPFSLADFDDYARLLADPEVCRYLTPDGRPKTRREAWSSLAFVLGHWQLRGFGLWAAEERASGQVVGRIGLHRPEGWPGLEVGWLVERDRWGEGLATEGARAALAYAFHGLGAARVVSVIHPENRASIRVAEKLGERFERSWRHGGRALAIYGIDRPELRAC